MTTFSVGWLRVLPGRAFRANHPQVLGILAFRKLIDDPLQLRLVDEAHPKRDFFQTRDLQSLAVLDRGDVISGFEQAGLRSGIEPRHSATERLHVEFVSGE